MSSFGRFGSVGETTTTRARVRARAGSGAGGLRDGNESRGDEAVDEVERGERKARVEALGVAGADFETDLA